jgi:hypothetical protein
MGEAWVAPVPHCPVHGKMRPGLEFGSWECRGFDGEDCAYAVAPHEITWTPIGEMPDDQWSAPFITRPGPPPKPARAEDTVTPDPELL